MAKKKVQSQALNLDLDYNNRNLAATLARDAAQIAYQNKRMELIEKGTLDLEADKAAKAYALEVSKQKFDQELAKLQFGANAILNAPRGPADYVSYLRKIRGLADTGGLPGVLGNVISGARTASSSNGGQATPDPISNVDLAMYVGQQGQQAMSQQQAQNPLPAASPSVVPQTQQVAPTYQQPQPTPQLAPGSPAYPTAALQHQPTYATIPFPQTQGYQAPQPAYQQPVNASYTQQFTPRATVQPTQPGADQLHGNGSSPYGDPYGSDPNAAAARRMFGEASRVPQNIPYGSQWSYQAFKKLNPTEQAMQLGYGEEYAGGSGQPREDIIAGMQRSAPNFARSPQARFSM